ncbi:MAG: hypothetical protein H6607_08370 [Flavobacteriales bacterium]|nr:hypothetical protein [Flavobacteriales bacterium]
MVFFQISQAQIIQGVKIETSSGKILIGELLDMEYEKYVTISTGMDSLTILWKDIVEIDFTRPLKIKDYNIDKMNQASRFFDIKSHGIYIMGDVGFPLGGSNQYVEPVLGITSQISVGNSWGYRKNLAILVGHDFYWAPQMGFLTTGIEYLGRMKTGGKSWFYYVNGGYGKVTYSEYLSSWWRNGVEDNVSEGGLFGGVGIGYLRKRHENNGLYFRLGYKIQNAYVEYNDEIWRDGNWLYEKVKENISLARFDARIGFYID